MWKPTKAGTYRYGDVNREAWLSNDKLMVRDMHTNLWCPVPDGPWSLLAPEWQDGAPTVEQLGRWQWWCIDFGYGQWVCQVEESESDGHVFAFGAVIDRQSVRRSAPVQPVPGEVLWVPMEVCK